MALHSLPFPRRVTPYCLVWFAAVTPAQGQIPSTADLADPVLYYQSKNQAATMIRSGDRTSAIPVLERLSRASPDDGEVVLMLAQAFRSVDCERATAYHERAIQLGWLDLATGRYEQAACVAQLQRPDDALALLQRALDAGYRFRVRLGRDSRFESLASDARFGIIAGMPGQPTSEREAGWRQDIDYLEREIRRTHHRFRTESLPTTFVEVRDALIESLGEASDEEIVVGLQRLVAQLGDGHSVVYPFGMERGTLRRLPISLYWFSDGLFIINAPEGREDWIGREVQAIGDVPTSDLLNSVRHLASHDNPKGLLWVSPTYLTFPAFVRSMGGAVDGDTMILDLRGDGGSERVAIVAEDVDPSRIDLGLIAPESDVVPPTYLARTGENYWFGEPVGGTLYVQFNRVLDGPGETLTEFALRLRGRLQQGDVQHLVVDVRNNNGGEGSLLRELVRTLVWFDSSREDAGIFVVQGRNTFSAAQTFIGQLDTLTDALFVGEPSGSKPNRVGDESLFRLPYSGVLGAIASGYHQTRSKDHRIWIAPDLPVSLSSADYFAGRDPALEAVASFIAALR